MKKQTKKKEVNSTVRDSLPDISGKALGGPSAGDRSSIMNENRLSLSRGGRKTLLSKLKYGALALSCLVSGIYSAYFIHAILTKSQQSASSYVAGKNVKWDKKIARTDDSKRETSTQ